MKFPKLNFKKIEIYAISLKNKKIFEYEFKKINFIISDNNSWKTTLFHIFKDILWIDNVIWSGVNWKSIFTADLLQYWFKVKLSWNIEWVDFVLEKEYISNSYDITFWDEKYTNIDSFWSDCLKKYNVNFPDLSDLNITSTISINSLLRLNFFSDDIFKKTDIQDNKFYCDIINHNKDSIFKILFYWYVFDLLDNKMLKENYIYLKEYRSIINDFKKITQFNTAITKMVNEGSGTLFNFDLDSVQDKIVNLDNVKKNLKLDRIKYTKWLEKIDFLLNEYKSINNYEDNNFKYFIDFLSSEKDIIFDEISEIWNKIEKIDTDIKINNSNYSSLSKSYTEIYDKKILDWVDDDINDALLDKIDLLKWKRDHYKSIYKNIVKEFYDNKSVKDLLVTYKNIVNKVFEDTLDTDIRFEDWKYTISTTSDSYRRITQLIVLSSLLLSDLKMFNFMFFDSPIIWIDKNSKEENKNFYVWKLFKELLNNNIEWQVILTTNDTSFDLVELFDSLWKDISKIKNNKYIDKDISILINENKKIFDV